MSKKQKKSKKESSEQTKKQGFHKNLLREYAEVVLWGFPLFLFFSTFVFQNFKIPTQSMENTLLIGDHLTVNTFLFSQTPNKLERALFPYRPPQRGDVMVFKYPGNPREKWVKRLVGLPGEAIKINNSHVHVNNEVLKEEYAFYRAPNRGDVRDPKTRFRPMDYYTLKPGIENAVEIYEHDVDLKDLIRKTRKTLDRYRKTHPDFYSELMARLESSDGVIPEGFYFLMGDNRNNSQDSRFWGLVPKELIEGRAYWVWWSYGEDLGSHNLSGFNFIKTYLRYPITFWTRTHWSESFTRIK